LHCQTVTACLSEAEEFVVGKREVEKWERLRRKNHWLDALDNACAAGHYAGARLVEDNRKPKRPLPHLRPSARELARGLPAWQ
jgi:hypothetical protein